jgi:hypothetical protein
MGPFLQDLKSGKDEDKSVVASACKRVVDGCARVKDEKLFQYWFEHI